MSQKLARSSVGKEFDSMPNVENVVLLLDNPPVFYFPLLDNPLVDSDLFRTEVPDVQPDLITSVEDVCIPESENVFNNCNDLIVYQCKSSDPNTSSFSK